jgi:hypothetical protein
MNGFDRALRLAAGRDVATAPAIERDQVDGDFGGGRGGCCGPPPPSWQRGSGDLNREIRSAARLARRSLLLGGIAIDLNSIEDR